MWTVKQLWARPHRSVLSDEDKEILADVTKSCNQLMAKLSELDSYVGVLHDQTGRHQGARRGGCGESGAVG